MSSRGRGYRLSAEAEADVRSIAHYIARQRPGASRRVLEALRTTFRELAARPHIGTSCDRLGEGVRYFTSKRPAHRYVVFFRPAEAADRVEIVAVVDGARDWPSLLGGPD